MNSAHAQIRPDAERQSNWTKVSLDALICNQLSARWNRPRKQRISLRVDVEVMDWFRSRGPGYQTRINRILRRVMMEGKNRTGER
jgi:uncharacterized protein (DUF4415 family)